MSQEEKIHIESLIYDDRIMDLRMEDVAANINAERKKRGLSLSALANAANLSVSCVSKAESAQCAVSLKTVLKIAAALEIPVSQLLEPTGTQAIRGIQPDEGRGIFEKITANATEDTTEWLLLMAEEIVHTLRRSKGAGKVSGGEEEKEEEE